MSKNFDIKSLEVLFVVAGARLNNLPVIINKFINLFDINKFTVVCPCGDINKASEILEGYIVDIINENEILQGCDKNKILDLIPINFPANIHHNYIGWYYQQFLKMAYSMHSNVNNTYLIWDADTIPLRKFDLFDNGKILITQGREYHKPYFKTINKIFNDHVNLQKKSHISQHMLVDKCDMKKMLDDLSTQEYIWWQNILRSLGPSPIQQFSEYETYSNYCLANWPDRYLSVRRNWFRFARSLIGKEMQYSNMDALSDYYDFVAFEEWDIGFRNSLRSKILFALDRFFILNKHMNNYKSM
jgi:hypothetical protein